MLQIFINILTFIFSVIVLLEVYYSNEFNPKSWKNYFLLSAFIFLALGTFCEIIKIFF